MFLSALLTIVKKRKPPKCSPADERIRSRERKRERESVCVCVFGQRWRRGDIDNFLAN